MLMAVKSGCHHCSDSARRLHKRHHAEEHGKELVDVAFVVDFREHALQRVGRREEEPEEKVVQRHCVDGVDHLVDCCVNRDAWYRQV